MTGEADMLKNFSDTIDAIIEHLQNNAETLGVAADCIEHIVVINSEYQYNGPVPAILIFLDPVKSEVSQSFSMVLETTFYVLAEQLESGSAAMKDAMAKAALLMQVLSQYNQTSFYYMPNDDRPIEIVASNSDRAVVAVNGLIPFIAYEVS